LSSTGSFDCRPSLSSQIFAIPGQQIECEKARRVPTVKQQIFELWSATSIQGANFAINDRCCIRQCSRDLLCKITERSEWMTVARDQLSTAMLNHSQCPEPVIFQLEDAVWIIEWPGL
jgi:hypothetical protein